MIRKTSNEVVYVKIIAKSWGACLPPPPPWIKPCISYTQSLVNRINIVRLDTGFSFPAICMHS